MIQIDEKNLCGASVLRVHGPLRVPVGGELRRSVTRLLGRGGRRILLDLSLVSALDAGGLGELINVYNATVAAHAVLHVVNASARVRELLDRAGVVRLLTGDTRAWSISERPSDRVA
ncbi:MAG TPA: STAS domain-containing protein [Vicinamibacterales bacterium]|jgi:anti-anti-sigma factor|nr:STAS domain-containing protein [Vicinamibacterales bacterium]